MKIPLRQLSRHLDGALAPVYLIGGDEPLLVADALDAIRAAARREGFDSRDVHVVDQGFRWDELLADAGNLSLFASRRIVEVRMPSPRPGDVGARVLRELAAQPDPDRILVVAIDARLDASTSQSQWAKALEKAGVLVEIWPIERAELPRWIAQRARGHRVKLTPAAAELLAERVEGNLLAAEQELMKLAILGGEREVDEAAVLDAVADSARFDVFRLTDAALAGDAPRAIRVLRGLEAEGTAPVLVSWALGRELGVLATLKSAASAGESLDAVFQRQRVWPKRRPLVQKALARFDLRALRGLLNEAVEVDAIVKGARGMPPWDALTRLVLGILNPPGARPRTRA